MQFRDKYRTLTFLSLANNSENLMEPLDFSTIERIFSILQELVLSFQETQNLLEDWRQIYKEM